MATRRIDKETTSEIVRHFGTRADMLVQILQAIVMRYGWVPEETIRQLADEVNLSRADVFGVVTYYHDFRTEPPGNHIVKVCQAEACQAMGSRALTKHARKALGANLHETNDDVTLEPVYCLGNCACAPAVMIDGKTHGRVNPARFDELVGAMKDSR
ncbi:MAG: NAD(P)H-dependent oxidoreductase subunit E [Gammaproteobacteria bacterium]|nr:NAD(P)H-dependent oxidoreductase subunit E [Gammaproteobacteria bacterium]MBT8111787.1 NAD(P)H-dependent oxidoreductase subunit E [Gammaproteobacteria bacterium]NND47185.1 formate dehydrogenase [Woeseiaceae bacterium]NNL46486.1 formate dehydrogenase [Woeseiaceae bacterium]